LVQGLGTGKWGGGGKGAKGGTKRNWPDIKVRHQGENVQKGGGERRGGSGLGRSPRDSAIGYHLTDPSVKFQNFVQKGGGKKLPGSRAGVL